MNSFILKLFAELNSSDVEYCHFKSNDHIDAGLMGDTDLDIVVLPGDIAALILLLYKFNFKIRANLNNISCANYI